MPLEFECFIATSLLEHCQLVSKSLAPDNLAPTRPERTGGEGCRDEALLGIFHCQ